MTESLSGCYPSKPTVAVGAVVFHQHRVLLVKRKKAPSRGIWAIPGGRVELGETLQQAAEREILEETGVTIHAGNPIFSFDTIERDPDGRIRYHYVITDVLGDYISGEPVADDDAVDARWISAGEIAELTVSKVTRELLSTQFSFGA